MVSRVLCGDQCESREEDGEGREGVRVSDMCGEGEAGQGAEGGKQVSRARARTKVREQREANR